MFGTHLEFWIWILEFPLKAVVPAEGVEPTHSHEYQILSLARLPIPPRRLLRGRNIDALAAK